MHINNYILDDLGLSRSAHLKRSMAAEFCANPHAPTGSHVFLAHAHVPCEARWRGGGTLVALALATVLHASVGECTCFRRRY